MERKIEIGSVQRPEPTSSVRCVLRARLSCCFFLGLDFLRASFFEVLDFGVCMQPPLRGNTAL